MYDFLTHHRILVCCHLCSRLYIRILATRKHTIYVCMVYVDDSIKMDLCRWLSIEQLSKQWNNAIFDILNAVALFLKFLFIIH